MQVEVFDKVLRGIFGGFFLRFWELIILDSRYLQVWQVVFFLFIWEFVVFYVVKMFKLVDLFSLRKKD